MKKRNSQRNQISSSTNTVRQDPPAEEVAPKKKFVTFKVKKFDDPPAKKSIGFKTRALSSVGGSTPKFSIRTLGGGKVIFESKTAVQKTSKQTFLLQVSRDRRFTKTHYSETFSNWPLTVNLRSGGGFYWRIKKVGDADWSPSSKVTVP